MDMIEFACGCKLHKTDGEGRVWEGWRERRPSGHSEHDKCHLNLASKVGGVTQVIEVIETLHESTGVDGPWHVVARLKVSGTQPDDDEPPPGLED